MNNSVLITGASSGIGKEIAITLAKEGYNVFAGVRSKADKIDVERNSKNIYGVYLDVTNEESIDKAFWYVQKKTDSLSCIINNAGIAMKGPIEFLPVEKFKEQFDVNTFGAVAIAQKFLPMMSEGKIINMSSMASSGIVPFAAAYGASKCAMDMIFNNLLIELNNPKIKIVSIKPGIIKTPFWEKWAKHSTNFSKYLPPIALEKYNKEIEWVKNRSRKNDLTGMDARRVVEVILKIIKSKNPKLSYILGFRAFCILAFSKFPQRFVNYVVRLVINSKIKN